MGLPQVNKDVPVHETTLPFSKKKVEFRPFLVKEEKILIIAAASDNADEQKAAVKQIIDNCTFTKVDLSKLEDVDVEWLMLELRKRSKGTKSPLSYRCMNEVDGKVCNTQIDVEADLEKVRYVSEADSDVIKLNEEIGLKMKLPKRSETRESESALEEAFDRIISCIDMVYAGDEVWHTKDLTRADLVDFIDTWSNDQLERVMNFVNNVPHLELDVEMTCPKCKYKEVVLIEGLDNFFD